MSQSPHEHTYIPAHIPVLLEECLEFLQVRPGLVWVDATIGAGGHLREMIARAKDSTVIGIDQDTYALKALDQEFGSKARLVHGNFADIKKIVAEAGCGTITGGILADLGVSSMQLDIAERGFSFMQDGPLDMRMDPTNPTTAADLVNKLTEKELADIIYKYGEERLSRRIARKIVEKRPVTTTAQLASIVASCIPKPSYAKSKNRDSSHPATRTFQALRIAVNDELGSLEKFLEDALAVLAPGARLVVITFHSLEDRLVKHFFRKAAVPCLCPPRQPICTCNKQPELLIITKKSVTASEKEVLANPRSRSAKLRVGEKLD